MNIRCGYVDVGGGQIHYRTSGDKGPAVILLHQTPLSSRMYERTLPHLGAHCRTFAIDTPGYGGSSPPPEPPAVEDYAESLLAAVSSLGVDRFAVAGFATGAAIAVEIARQAGEKTTHVVLSGTPFLSEERMQSFAVALGEPAVRRDGQHFLQVWSSRLDNYGRDSDVDQIQMAASETLRVYDRLHWGLLAVARYDFASALAQLRGPVLFLTAENDKLAPENRAAAALVDGSTETVRENGMPQLCWTEPEWFSMQVKDFIAAR